VFKHFEHNSKNMGVYVFFCNLCLSELLATFFFLAKKMIFWKADIKILWFFVNFENPKIWKLFPHQILCDFTRETQLSFNKTLNQFRVGKVLYLFFKNNGCQTYTIHKYENEQEKTTTLHFLCIKECSSIYKNKKIFWTN
jgi:hypothetical protein